jgi:hypothetical protein
MATKGDSTKIWKKRKPLARTALKRFLQFMNKQDKIRCVDDLVPNLHYKSLYNLCTPTYTRRASLRKGITDAREKGLVHDAVINIEVESADPPGIYMYIWSHKTGKPLFELSSWEEDH